MERRGRGVKDVRVGAGLDGEGDHVVIVRIATDRGDVGGILDEHGPASELVNEVVDVSEGEVGPEPVAAQRAGEFIDQLGADDQIELPKSPPLQKLSRTRSRRDPHLARSRAT
jgi:hypothetical protein